MAVEWTGQQGAPNGQAPPPLLPNQLHVEAVKWRGKLGGAHGLYPSPLLHDQPSVVEEGEGVSGSGSFWDAREESMVSAILDWHASD